jgi:hypothetical protein
MQQFHNRIPASITIFFNIGGQFQGHSFLYKTTHLRWLIYFPTAKKCASDFRPIGEFRRLFQPAYEPSAEMNLLKRVLAQYPPAIRKQKPFACDGENDLA